MEAVKTGILKGAGITVQCGNQERADGVGVSACFSSILAEKSHLEAAVFGHGLFS